MKPTIPIVRLVRLVTPYSLAIAGTGHTCIFIVALSAILRENTIPRIRDCYSENPGLLFRESGIAIPRIRDCYSENPGLLSRESGIFSESPGSFPRVRVASARIRKTCHGLRAWARQWGVFISACLSPRGQCTTASKKKSSG